MLPDRLELLINNDKEWRIHILNKLDKLEENQQKHGLFINTLKVKMAMYSLFFGFIGSIGYTLLIKITGK